MALLQVSESEIEERVEEIKELMKIWMRFYRILSAGFDPKTLTPEKEQEFNTIKTVVAQRHRHFMEAIDDDEDKYIGQNILNLVKRVISLQEFSKLSSLEINKISIEWHDANILLNELLGDLEYRLDAAKKGTKVRGTEKQEKEKQIKEVTPGAMANKTVKFAFILVVLGAAIAAIVVFREEIQNSEFYVKYLESYVDLVLQIFE